MRRCTRRRKPLVAAAVIALAFVVKACSPELDWREFTWPEGGFSALLPAKPAKEVRKSQIGSWTLNLTMLSVQLDALAYGIGYADLPDALAAADRETLIRAARDQLAANVKASPSQERSVGMANATGIAFAAEGAAIDGRALTLLARAYVTDRRFYQLVVVGTRERIARSDAELFLESFKLLSAP